MDWHMRLERAPGIEVRDAPDGLIAYDAGRERLHYLNRTAALLLESCDGTLTAGELGALLAAAFDLDTPPTSEVEACLSRLLDEGLLIAVSTA